ncbi:helix-turn-helix transcriptional regulator [Amycolatopsis acidicola]|uniref:Helix-turn-helix transcriptional regulator n=1 Tax=Amycolatopsis acidicola TaxID=2596893 RepID=A0A5N0UW16_9PSEU|nr:helix-turn-helix transcriptional regulator [Amycolatopsis acidicola]
MRPKSRPPVADRGRPGAARARRIAVTVGRIGNDQRSIRCVAAAYGETPKAYLTRRRIERAQDLLRSVNLSVTEICVAVGFTSLGTFTELTGESPSAYRAKAHADGPPAVPGCYLMMWTRPSNLG